VSLRRLEEVTKAFVRRLAFVGSNKNSRELQMIQPPEKHKENIDVSSKGLSYGS
jgi:hypothetical protein